MPLDAKGVRVNSVNPGTVVSELHKRGGMDNETYSSYMEECKTTHPLGRVGQPEDVADLIIFVASEKASWITGQIFTVDGGRSLTLSGGHSIFASKDKQ